MDSELELISVIFQMIPFIIRSSEFDTDTDSDSDSDSRHTSKLVTLSSKLISLINLLDLDSQPKPESEFISLLKQAISVGNSISESGHESELVPVVPRMISLISSIESDPNPNPDLEAEFMSLTAQVFSQLNSMDWDLESVWDSKLASLINQIWYLVKSIYTMPPMLKLIRLIKKLMPLTATRKSSPERDSKVISLIAEIISVVCSMDLDSQPKPESELMSLITQTIFLFNSMDFDSQPEPLRKLISFITQIYFCLINSSDSETDFMSLVDETLSLEPQPELISLVVQVTSFVFSMNTKWEKIISLCPQVEVIMKKGKLHVDYERYKCGGKLECLSSNWDKFKLTEEEDNSHFLCAGCNGKNHKEYNMAPVEIKHPLHPKHFLQLVLLKEGTTRQCYCCEKDLEKILYYCAVCDFAINFACLQKSLVLSMDHPKWHQHTLALFPRNTSLTCSVCALTHPSCPFYICPPCDFVIHQRCISLPYVIRISRHPHRISFTPSFDQRDWSCGVCRKKIDNDYGGYSCIKDGCSYAAHSRCATQSNVWDGKELEGVPEEDNGEVEPFVTISDGIIKHFSHEHHHMRHDANTSRDYKEDQLCQACITPIYFGNFYSCMQCDYILHEACAKFSRKMYHPIHPHLLTLQIRNKDTMFFAKRCSACLSLYTDGFIYKCGEKTCKDFQLHLQCATISEPLVHESHMQHPLFLTSKPEEDRICSACKDSRNGYWEMFNCIEECDFALCFGCATLPQKIRYKHDKHMLTLSYGNDTNTMIYWCEICELEINPKNQFYMCDKYCCVTLHIDCLLGRDLYMKPLSFWIYCNKFTKVLPNNNHMSRPICYGCNRRCPQNVVFKILSSLSSTYCSLGCS